MNFNLTRIAPTPSGFLHLGNAYSFLLTKFIAEETGAKILLRIDDLDRERYRKEYVEDIFDTLDFLEIAIDQGPKNVKEFESDWSQLHRMEKYQEGMQKLRDSKLVFGCDCSRKKILEINPAGNYLGYCLDRRIPLTKPDIAWRINTLDADFVSFLAYSTKKITQLIPEETAFYIIKKKDEAPSYQLASVIDDEEFGVDLIVRGNDLYPSTLAQLDLARLLELSSFPRATFHHHAILKGPDKTKLSKSSGSTSIQFLRKEGKTLLDVLQLIGQMARLSHQVSSLEELKSHILPMNE